MARKARLDRASVLEAAVDLLNREGSGALTMSRLAGQLGVQTPSLYNHVDGLPGLMRQLALLNARRLAERLAEAAIGKAGPQAFTAVAHAFREHIKADPGLYLATLRVSANQSTVDPELQREEERILRIIMAVIASFGLSGEDALHAVRSLRSVVHGFVTLEIMGGFGMPLDCEESFRRLVEILIRGLQAPQPV